MNALLLLASIIILIWNPTFLLRFREKLIILPEMLTPTPQMMNKALNIETDKNNICLSNELYSCNR